MKKTDQIRIVDIARMADVSAGTVDRILHDRGHVSQKSRQKVEKILREIDYKPNIYASALAFKRREYRIVYLMPTHNAGDYWDVVESGIKRAGEEFSFVNVVIDTYYYNQFEVSSFEEAFREALLSEPLAVLFAPVFPLESRVFIDEMDKTGVAYSYFDSKLKDTNETTYYGQDSFASGFLACKMLANAVNKDEEVALFISSRMGETYSNQTSSRRDGVLKYIKDNELNYQIEELKVRVQYPAEAMLDIEAFFEKHPDIKGIIALNSRVYMLCDYLKQVGRNDIFVVGFDPLERNINYLRNGYVNVLIGNHPDIQGYKCVKALCDSLILKQSVKKNNFMPLDILLLENIDYYQDLDQI